MANGFTLERDAMDLPPGAIARAERHILRQEGRPVLGLTQGRMRPYVFPLLTPAGYLATSEAPADHPHHNSLWIAADHVHAHVPTGPGLHEVYTYNFYVDETFQGRAAGTLVGGTPALGAAGLGAAALDLAVEWRGPAEWGAPSGRTIAREARRITVRRAGEAWLVDVVSTLSAAERELALGPTRHAYFNIRVAETMTAGLGGTVRDDRGRSGAAGIGTTGARWVAFEGPVGGGARAGIVVIPDPADEADTTWFVADWGVVSVGSFRQRTRLLAPGEPLRQRFRALVHDGPMDDAAIAAFRQTFPA
jgi:hypothetical protein